MMKRKGRARHCWVLSCYEIDERMPFSSTQYIAGDELETAGDVVGESSRREAEA
jgi:hypothetical protein